jgi:hypothetical protein
MSVRSRSASRARGIAPESARRSALRRWPARQATSVRSTGPPDDRGGHLRVLTRPGQPGNRCLNANPDRAKLHEHGPVIILSRYLRRRAARRDVRDSVAHGYPCSLRHWFSLAATGRSRIAAETGGVCRGPAVSDASRRNVRPRKKDPSVSREGQWPQRDRAAMAGSTAVAPN